MDSIRAYFGQFTNQFRTFWSTTSNLNKGIMAGVLALILVAFSSLLFINKEDNSEYLFVNLSKEDTAAISSFLNGKDNIHYTIDEKGIKVPKELALELRNELSLEGLPEKGVVGWEKFDEDNFTRTEFEQKIQKQRALEGELTRTISAIKGITSAKVHLVQPKNSLFVRDQKKTTASILIKTKRGVDLETRQIRGIQHLVSRSVEGLETNDVIILDAQGRMLTKVESTDEGSRMSQERLLYKDKVENEFEERIRNLIGRIVGPDRVETNVDVDVDFTQEKQLISDIDPDDVAVISKNSSGFSMEGSGLNPVGIPGVKSNVPGEEENVTATGNKAGSKRDTELVNYVVSKINSEKTLPLGDIKRISASVLVDGRQFYPLDGTKPVFEPRSKDEMEQIEKLVKGALGIKEGRDTLVVSNLMFQLDPFQVQEISKKKEEDRLYISSLSISAAVALALVLFFAFIVRPYFRWLSYDPEKKREKSNIEEFKPDLDVAEIQNIKIQEDIPFEKLSPQDQVLYLAKHEPKRTTEAIRMLLNPGNY